MSLPYFPMYPTDFEADTSHLTLAEDGAYNRLLRLMWMTPGCSLPDDEAWLMRRMRVDQETFDRVVRVVLDEFFQRKGGRITNRRLAKEWQKNSLAHRKRVEAGSKGGKAKAAKTNAKTSSNALAKPKQPEPEPEPDMFTEEAKASSPAKRAKRLPDDWVLPNEYELWALDEGWPQQTIREEAEIFKDYWIAKAGRDAAKKCWFSTWRNWMRRKPKNGGRNGERTYNNKVTPMREDRVDPALEQIARLARSR